MGVHFEGDLPIYVQIKRTIEDMIVEGRLKAHEKVPSTTEMVKFYQVNHITVAKGVNQLVEEGVVYKKRGVGMFVSENAKETLLTRRRNRLKDRFIKPLLSEAQKLEVDVEEIIRMIHTTKEDKNED